MHLSQGHCRRSKGTSSLCVTDLVLVRRRALRFASTDKLRRARLFGGLLCEGREREREREQQGQLFPCAASIQLQQFWGVGAPRAADAAAPRDCRPESSAPAARFARAHPRPSLPCRGAEFALCRSVAGCWGCTHSCGRPCEMRPHRLASF